MVVKGHEAKSPFLPGRALLHDVDALDLAVLFKVLADVVLFSVLLNAANKDLFHSQMGAWLVGVLGQEGQLFWGDGEGKVGLTEHRDDVAAGLLWGAALLLPLSTRHAWVQQFARPLCEASLSWPRRPPPLRNT